MAGRMIRRQPPPPAPAVDPRDIALKASALLGAFAVGAVAEYFVLDVFAWHVQELRDVFEHGRLGELQCLDPEQPDRAWFGFRRNGTDYQIKVHRSGMAQITRRATGRLELSRDQLAQGRLDPEVVRRTELPGDL